ncbi:MAG: nucleotidyltransferase family protein [Bryobacteraceae bacterium]
MRPRSSASRRLRKKTRSSCLPVAAIVLAAGAAKRMGRLKQLLPYSGRTLVQHAVEQAVEAGFTPIIAVVGSDAEAVRKSIAAQPVEITHNSQWQSGMGSSIAAGVRALRESGADSAAVAILLVDQPLVTSHHLKTMRNLLHKSASPIVAAEYNGTVGVPALFKRELFAKLASLAPEAGARDLLRNSGYDMAAFPLPEAAIDIDTPEDFAALTSSA